MDPLSITSGTIAILGLAVQAAKTLDSLKSVHRLPADFRTLLAEVADLQHQLEQCQSVIKSHSQAATQLHTSGLVKHSHAAKDKLEHLESLIHVNTFRNGLASRKELKAFWTGLVHGKSRLSSYRDELRDVRFGLASSLAVLTAPVVCGIDNKVDSILEAQKDFQSAQLNLLRGITQGLQAQAATAQPPPPYPFGNQGNPDQPFLTAVDMTRTKPGSLQVAQRGVSMNDVKMPIDRLGVYCNPWCSCQCHALSHINSYDALRSMFGSLSISHAGLPGLTQPCNQKKTCRRRMSPKLSLRYRFPRAWATFQSITCTFSTLAGPELRIKLPRVVDWTSPLWQYAIAGNVQAVQNLFRNGLASPWDVSPLGGNLLHYAADHWNANLCRLLLDADVDPEAADDWKSTPVAIAWERVLSAKMSANDASTVASLFQNTDYLASRSFTVIHKVVLGLLSKDLDAELSCSTAEIDTKDSQGRTPLSWASARGDEVALRTLLAYHADPRIVDAQGNTPLHYVRNTACAEQLLAHNADLHALNTEKQTPLFTACRNIRSASLALALIQAGSDVNAIDVAKETPLHLVHGEFMPFFNVLLDAGADINAPNDSGDSPLRLAIIANWHEMLLRIIRERPEADFGGINAYGQSFAHAIARTADLETMRILAAARPASLSPDLESRDRAGKSAMQYFNERVDFLEDDEEGALRECVDELMGALAQSNKGENMISPSIVESIVGLGGKVDIVLSVAEAFDDLDPVPDVFHDAVETF